MRVRVRAHFEGGAQDMQRSLLGMGLGILATLNACHGSGSRSETNGSNQSGPTSGGAQPGNGGGGSPGGPGGPGTTSGGKGYFHTEGSRIVDESGRAVRLTGVNWFGLETQNFTLHGLWARSLDS